MYGPKVAACESLHSKKYRLPSEPFDEAMARIAVTISDNNDHFLKFKDILLNMRFMPAGRVQSAMGSPRDVTAFNCFVSGTIEDSMDSIMSKATEAAETMRRGGGIGYDFSRIRPSGDRIVSLDSTASGPISFMHIYDAVCHTIVSAGHRRGAMMGVLRVDHPDVEQFIRAKRNNTKLTNFNISVGVTDDFMECVVKDKPFDLKFNGKVYNQINAAALWDEIMRSNWDWAEPGVLFLDRINSDNPLNYCEQIETSNPCGEQPLPPYGACLLGSFNLVKYVSRPKDGTFTFDMDLFREDIPPVVRAMDNVVDRTRYPLKQQEVEAKKKRRMGLGITGLGNVFTLVGVRYGSPESLRLTKSILRTLCYTAYETSSDLALEKGVFPAFDKEKYLDSGAFIRRLPDHVRSKIAQHGIRNSHLISIAPTGTISFCADNISSGLEPTFANELDRTVITEDGSRIVKLKDYVFGTYGITGVTTDELTPMDHLSIQITAQPFVDSAISKTINVGENVSFEAFKEVYTTAWRGKLKGVTTFRGAGKRYGILNKSSSGEQPITTETETGSACFIDPVTGTKACSD